MTTVLPLVGSSGPVSGVSSTSGTASPPSSVPSGVTAGTYGDATHVAQFTVNENGDITAAADVLITSTGGGGSCYIPVITGAIPAVFVQWPDGTLLLVGYP